MEKETAGTKRNKKMLFIMNPRAGTMLAAKFLVEILEVFEKGGYVVTIVMTRGQGDGKTIAMEQGAGMDLIACAGGDGTLNEVIEGVLSAGYTCPIGYIPAGSTNDFGASIGLPSTIMDAARTVVEGVPHTLDIGSFNGRYFSYVASFGAFTSTSYTVPQNIKNIMGHTAYVLQGVKDMLSIHPIHARIAVEDGDGNIKNFENDYIFGAVCNSRSVGGMVKIKSDDVDMNDGVMELVLIKNPDNFLALQQVAKALLDGSMKSEYIKFLSARKIDVKIEPGTHWTLDGEYEEGREENVIKTLHSAIRIIVPEDDEYA